MSAITEFAATTERVLREHGNDAWSRSSVRQCGCRCYYTPDKYAAHVTAVLMAAYETEHGLRVWYDLDRSESRLVTDWQTEVQG